MERRQKNSEGYNEEGGEQAYKARPIIENEKKDPFQF